MNKNKLGVFGENLAADYLEKEGYKILERNFHCSFGEIDIICEKRKNIFFVEVKTRRSISYGMPSEAVDWNKKEHIRNVAAFYMQTHQIENRSIEFQVMEIVINQIKNAF